MELGTVIGRNFFNINIGYMDRQIRFIVGFVAIVIAMLVPEHSYLVKLTFLTSIPVISSAILGWDPIYALFGKRGNISEKIHLQQRNWCFSNLGIVDRVVRAILGVSLIGFVLYNGITSYFVIFPFISILIISSAIIAWDPIYALFRINSFANRSDAIASDAGVCNRNLERYFTVIDSPKNNNNDSSNPLDIAA